MLDDGELALDVRPGEDFAKTHVPGSVNIALSGQFASWTATVLGLSARPVLIAAAEDQIEEARIRLARVGIEVLAGYLGGGISAWQRAGFASESTPEMTVAELHDRLQSNDIQVLDVRREPEWEGAHIEQAVWWPLDNFKVSPPEMNRDVPIAVHCKSGYRSMIAASLLQRAGFRNVINLAGGFDAWQQANLPSVGAKPVGA